MKSIWLRALIPAVLLAGPARAENLTFEPRSGVITPPFILTNGCLCQTVQTSLADGGRAIFTFTLTNAGSYVLQALVHAPSGQPTSFCVNLDAEPSEPAMIWDVPATSGFTNRFVSWRAGGAPTGPAPYKIFNLTPGTHQVILRGSAANAQLQRLSLLKLPSAPAGLRIVAGP